MRCVSGLKVLVVVALALGLGLTMPPLVAGPPQVAPATNCVTIAAPKPGVGYTYEHIESTGGRSQFTQYWEQVSDTGSRVRIVRAGQEHVQTSVYTVQDDVARITRMTKAGAGRVIDSTTFSPGLVSDPVFRACSGGRWPIPSVTLVYEGSTNARAPTPAGTLTIASIGERVTVPAGTFDTVHYLRTSQSRDDYWKSIQHGVIVKHVATVAGHSVSETLISIK